MKITELIKLLQQAKNEYGENTTVYINLHGFHNAVKDLDIDLSEDYKENPKILINL